MTFEEFIKSMADAVERAVAEAGQYGPCYLCGVLHGWPAGLEGKAREYMQWDGTHAETLCNMISEAEVTMNRTFRQLLRVEYRDLECFENAARVQWLRDGAPAFWRK